MHIKFGMWFLIRLGITKMEQNLPSMRKAPEPQRFEGLAAIKGDGARNHPTGFGNVP
jgi:hypothetical protein